jgi:myosin heavy subunit
MLMAMDDLMMATATEKKLSEPHLRGSTTDGTSNADYYVNDPVWVTHPEEAWVPGKITALVDGTHVRVSCESRKHGSGEKVATFYTTDAESTLKKKDSSLRKSSSSGSSLLNYYILPRDHRMQSKLGVENMDNMVHLHEAAVLDNLRKRFKFDLIYTSTGPILIAMNPFKRLPIYSKDQMLTTNQKLLGGGGSTCEPHVFTTVGQSYIAMQETDNNQSMVICGESGAGKTETTKLMLRYLSKTASRKDGGGEIEEQILESNPLMEAFGNAKTLRNDNSSRFGKYIRVQFNEK